MILFESTIAAIATPLGTGGVGVIRLSGSQSWQIAHKLCPGSALAHGKIAYRWLIDPSDNTAVDEIIVLPFKAPKSLTGEDCIEIQCHGGLTLTQKILSLCCVHGAQLATAGEFTRRAVLNGKMDLTQAESVLDLIHAEGEALLKAAASNLKHRHIGRWLEETLEGIASVQADMTASIDFPDEVEEPDRESLLTLLKKIETQLTQNITTSQSHQLIRHGLKVAIVGQPNAGKSSLFNALLAKEKAIVTDIAGTTRDVLEAVIQINGVPVLLMDTAGLRENSQDKVEQIGIERTHIAADDADAIIWVIDGADNSDLSNSDNYAEKWSDKNGLQVLNKQDLKAHQTKSNYNLPLNWSTCSVSAQTKSGLLDINTWIKELLEKQLPDLKSITAVLSDRQLLVLEQVNQNVKTAIETLNNKLLPLDIATVPLTDSLLALQGLLGRDTTEDMLDKVFQKFCVGK